MSGEEGSQTFLFADLAGFTALTEAHGDEKALEICLRFTTAVTNLADGTDNQVVKTIGDAVMIRSTDPRAALSLGEEIVHYIAEHRAPPVRVGMHTGPAIEADGDYFGSTVNIASRVSGAARPGEVLITEATRAALPADVALEPKGRRFFKNVFERVPVYAAAGPRAGHELEIDPVCRMAVDRELTARVVGRHGQSHYFCSSVCADAFEAEPRRYVARSPAARSARATFISHLRFFVVAQATFAIAWAAGLALGAPSYPWFLLVLVGWGIPLALHYRAVRRLL